MDWLRTSIKIASCAAGLCVAMAACVPATAQGQLGQLGQLRGEVRQPAAPPQPAQESPPEKKKSRRNSQNAWDDDNDDWGDLFRPFGTIAFWGVATVVTSPVWGPVYMLDDHYERRAYYLDYPYQDGESSNLVISPTEPGNYYTWSGRLRGEYLDDFSGLSFIGGQLLLEHSARFGLDTEVHYRRESVGMGRHDSLWTGDANLVYRFAQSPNVQLRCGVGMNWLSDQSNSDFGFNFTYGGDWFLYRPFISSTELDLGTLGDSELLHFRTTLGVQRNHFEVYAGYDLYQVGGASLDGFVSGVRLWW